MAKFQDNLHTDNGLKNCIKSPARNKGQDGGYTPGYPWNSYRDYLNTDRHINLLSKIKPDLAIKTIFYPRLYPVVKHPINHPYHFDFHPPASCQFIFAIFWRKTGHYLD